MLFSISWQYSKRLQKSVFRQTFSVKTNFQLALFLKDEFLHFHYILPILFKFFHNLNIIYFYNYWNLFYISKKKNIGNKVI